MNSNTAAANLPQIYSVKQAAKLAGVSDMTLYKAIRAGLLRSIRLTGKEQSIRHEDLRAWLNGETQPDQKDINADHSVSAGEIMDRMGLLQALGITNPQPNTERKTENEKK